MREGRHDHHHGRGHAPRRERRGPAPRARAGVTLIELMVTLALIAVMAGVAGIAIARAKPPRAVTDVAARVLAARADALRSGRVVNLVIAAEGHVYAVTALPDGRLLADPALGVDPLTGEVRHDDAPDAPR